LVWDGGAIDISAMALVHILGNFDPEIFLEALEEFEITVISAIPRSIGW